jgi:ActR/RegA family two-component response regulator
MAMPKYLYHYLFSVGQKRKKENLPSLQNLKKDYIGYVFKLTDCNISEASGILQVSPPTLYKILKKSRTH